MDDASNDGLFNRIQSVLSTGDYSLAHLAFAGIEAIFIFMFVKLFGGIAYDRRYLRGKWFNTFWAPGWRWAFNGLLLKLFTGHGRGVPWPISSECNCSPNIDFDPDELNNFQVSTFFQAVNGARISLGHNVWIAQGCCLITSNHDLYNPELHQKGKDIYIGDHCWLGANAVIMPGVILGPHTVVGANAVVTKSFPNGRVVLAGVPARVIKNNSQQLNSSVVLNRF